MRWEKPPVLQGEILLAETVRGNYEIVHSLDIETLNNTAHTVAYRVEEIRNIFEQPFRFKLEIHSPPRRFAIRRVDGVIEDFDY